MLKSMTGFGQATCTLKGRSWLVEARSVNHRYFDCSSKLPPALAALESDVKTVVQRTVKRGKVHVLVTADTNKPDTEEIQLDEKKVKFYLAISKTLGRKFNVEDKATLGELLTLPHLFTVQKVMLNPHEAWRTLQPALTRALATLSRAKSREGKALKQDLEKRVRLVLQALQKIEKEAGTLAEQYRDKIATRVQALTAGLALEDERLEKEVALLAERSDITEEVVRLKHHITQFKLTLQAQDAVGKRLDFILQEMGREANTIASKAANAPIASQVIQIKSELEKMREQVQNVE